VIDNTALTPMIVTLVRKHLFQTILAGGTVLFLRELISLVHDQAVAARGSRPSRGPGLRDS